MSKKRVHELAKQLKEQGIELSNAELVDKLHQLGYDVKSHSSSLEDDQATAAYEKIVSERKPKAAPVRPAGPGFVVRKRAHAELVEPPRPAAAPHPVAPPPAEPAPVEAPFAAAAAASAEPVTAAASVTAPVSSVEEPAQEAAPAPAEAAPKAPPAVAAEPVAQEPHGVGRTAVGMA